MAKTATKAPIKTANANFCLIVDASIDSGDNGTIGRSLAKTILDLHKNYLPDFPLLADGFSTSFGGVCELVACDQP
ncbi:MAG: hypothetical protein WA851_01110 [Xanthobacteraceae bacterium]